MNQADPESIQRAINMAQNSPCIICRRLSDYGTAVSFIPDNPQEYGAAPGQKRLIFYSLCPECSQAPGAFKRAEKIIKLDKSSGSYRQISAITGDGTYPRHLPGTM